MKTGRFYGVGLGPGDPGLVTLRTAEILRAAHVVYTVASRQSERSVSGAIINALPGVTARREELKFTIRQRAEKLKEKSSFIFPFKGKRDISEELDSCDKASISRSKR